MRKILIAIALLAGCAHPQTQTVETWQGKHIDQLTSAWGPANTSQTLENGGKVYAYSHDTAVAQRFGYAVVANSVPCSAWFTTDRQGVIVNARISGAPISCNNLMRYKSVPQ